MPNPFIEQVAAAYAATGQPLPADFTDRGCEPDSRSRPQLRELPPQVHSAYGVSPVPYGGNIGENLAQVIAGERAEFPESSEALHPLAGISDYGFEYLAWYVPLHENGPQEWGIFFHGPRMHHFGQQLQRQMGEPDLMPVLALACKAILHHERFHFFVECHATAIEQARCLETYVPYKEKVYRPHLGRVTCVEESLANAYALTRRYDTRALTNTSPSQFRKALEFFCKGSPGAYRETDRYLLPSTVNRGGKIENLKGYCGMLAEIIRDAELPHAPFSDWRPRPGVRFDLGPDLSQRLVRSVPLYVAWGR